MCGLRTWRSWMWKALLEQRTRSRRRWKNVTKTSRVRHGNDGARLASRKGAAESFNGSPFQNDTCKPHVRKPRTKKYSASRKNGRPSGAPPRPWCFSSLSPRLTLLLKFLPRETQLVTPWRLPGQQECIRDLRALLRPPPSGRETLPASHHDARSQEGTCHLLQINSSRR